MKGRHTTKSELRELANRMIDEFDWTRTMIAMNALRWRYSKGPKSKRFRVTLKMAKKCAIDRLAEVIEAPEKVVSMMSGGFIAEKARGTLRLSFVPAWIDSEDV